MATNAWTRKPGPRLVSGIVTIVVGVVLLIGGTIGLAATLSPLFGITAADGTATKTLSANTTYDVWVDSNDGTCSFSITTVTVKGPDGPVASDYPSTFVPINTNLTTWCNAAEFKTGPSGTYTAHIDDDTNSGRVAIVRSIGGLFNDAVPSILIVVVGGICATVGLILTIVGLVRRKRANRRQLIATAPPMPQTIQPPSYDPRPMAAWTPPPAAEAPPAPPPLPPSPTTEAAPETGGNEEVNPS